MKIEDELCVWQVEVFFKAIVYIFEVLRGNWKAVIKAERHRRLPYIVYQVSEGMH